jgi:pyrroloquinoline quinone (PQQ) biosynthesis protein C
MSWNKQETAFSTRLRFKLQPVVPLLYGAGGSLAEGTNVRERFKGYLMTLHSIIRASTPLMKAGEYECLRTDDDQLCSALAKYYRKHTKEEMDHDRWLLADLEAIGVSRRETLSRMPTQAVAELVGVQYYWIHHLHPVCLLGYIAILEGYPPQKKGVKKLMKKTGYPEAAFRTLAEHSDLDPHHVEELDAVLDALPLDRRQEEWITLNAIYTIRRCTEILNSI